MFHLSKKRMFLAILRTNSSLHLVHSTLSRIFFRYVDSFFPCHSNHNSSENLSRAIAQFISHMPYNFLGFHASHRNIFFFQYNNQEFTKQELRVLGQFSHNFFNYFRTFICITYRSHNTSQVRRLKFSFQFFPLQMTAFLTPMPSRSRKSNPNILDQKHNNFN